MITIKATPVLAYELEPGELFSVRGPRYWDRFGTRDSCGESVYIRTAVPANQFPDFSEIVYRISIIQGENNDG